MKSRLGVIGCAALVVATAVSASFAQDGRHLQRLEWTAPNGELPGTLAEYRATHPLTEARFANAQLFSATAARSPMMISILVHSTLYSSIQPALSTYVNDLLAEGYSVYWETVSGGTPETIKAWVQQRYAAGSEGIVFIGDIPAAWAEVSEDVFPSDLFYMDLDGTWTDADGDGDYEGHVAGSGDEGPEVYVARIYAHTLTYASEASMVNGYLAKAHAYHHGQLTQPWRGLEYIEEDWYDMDVHLNEVYGGDIAHYDYGYFTTSADYLSQLALGQHFVQVCAHSYSGGHHFGMRPTESAIYAHVYVYSPTTRAARLRTGSDDGIKAWLNGSMVLNRDQYRGWVADQDTASVTLQSGWNRLLCKISQGGGDYQFSARFTAIDGTPLTDLSYQLNDPTFVGFTDEDAPVDGLRLADGYIGDWLANGPYVNSNSLTRLSQDYLGGESSVQPNAGDPAAFGVWEQISSDGYPVNLGTLFDHDGGWVFSSTIQQRNPPVLFYNLFACGPGRFTDQNYLAGAYIFNTTWGLITIASAKSGSMLEFLDFTAPLGEGATVGDAYLAWFDAQAPFELWEREWYYGMVLNGDPTLRPISRVLAGDMNCDGAVNFGDINPFVEALLNASNWHGAHPGCPIHNGDLSGDGALNFADINPFVALLLN